MKPRGWHTGVVRLWDLPKDKVYIDLKEPFKSNLIKLLINEAGNKTYLARCIGYNFDSARNFFDRGQTKSLEFIEKLLTFLSEGGVCIDKEEIEKEVKYVQVKNGHKIYNPKFPINFNSEKGAIIVSSLFHDGGIVKEENPTVGSCVFYRNYRYELMENVLDAFRTVVGEMNIKLQKNNTSVFFPKIMGLIIIHGLGLKSGPKVKVNPRFPDFIFNSDEYVRCSFLKQAFDDEGSVSIRNGQKRGLIEFWSTIDVSHFNDEFRRKIQQENLYAYAPNILKENKKLLQSIGITVSGPVWQEEYTTKKGHTSHGWRVRIYRKDSILKFHEKVGFGAKDKQNKLEKIVNLYKK